MASYSPQINQHSNGSHSEFGASNGDNGSFHNGVGGGTIGGGGLGSTLKPLKSVFGRKNRASSNAGSLGGARGRSGSINGGGPGGASGFDTLADETTEQDHLPPLPVRNGSSFGPGAREFGEGARAGGGGLGVGIFSSRVPTTSNADKNSFC